MPPRRFGTRARSTTLRSGEPPTRHSGSPLGYAHRSTSNRFGTDRSPMGGRRLGAEVIPALSRRELADPASRTQALVQQLASSGTMTAGIRIPGAVGDLSVTADLRAGQITSTSRSTPRTGRQATKVNWLVRQLKALSARREQQPPCRWDTPSVPASSRHTAQDALRRCPRSLGGTHLGACIMPTPVRRGEQSRTRGETRATDLTSRLLIPPTPRVAPRTG